MGRALVLLNGSDICGSAIALFTAASMARPLALLSGSHICTMNGSDIYTLLV